MRTTLLTACVLVAIATVWAVALGIVDGLQLPPEPLPRSALVASRAVRRPVLFVVCPHRGEPGPGVAIPIAAIEPDWSFRSPLVEDGPEDVRRAEEGAFVATYCYQGAELRLLSGGAFAGTLSYGSVATFGAGLPAVRVVSDGTGASMTVDSTPEDLLGISDPRFGASMSGARAMQTAHRSAVEQLTRVAIKERYPQWQIESADLARVRVADLDRTGEPELLASRTVRLRSEGSPNLSVAIFLIGETETGATESFRLAYAAVGEAAPDAGAMTFAYVDQANLTPAADDEIILRSDRGGSTSYLILQRTSGRWREVFASRPITSP
jgi:hypothetical protein